MTYDFEKSTNKALELLSQFKGSEKIKNFSVLSADDQGFVVVSFVKNSDVSMNDVLDEIKHVFESFEITYKTAMMVNVRVKVL